MSEGCTVIACRKAEGDAPAKDGYWVTFDTGRSVCLTAEEIAAYGIYEGAEMHAPADTLLEHVLYQRMLLAVSSYVLYCKRTEQMVRKRITQWHGWNEAAWIPYRDGALEKLIAYLTEQQYLDDVRYSRAYVRANRQKPVAARALKQALMQRGVDEETAEMTVREAELDEQANARTVLERRTRGKVRTEPLSQQERAKLFRFLCGRGFSSETARRAIEEWETGQYAEDAEE